MTTSSENGREGELLGTQTPPVVSAEEWMAAWEELHVKEKAHSRARDALAAERRRMPWLAVEKGYAFEGPNGRVSLLDLFAGRRQLIVYRLHGPWRRALAGARLYRLFHARRSSRAPGTSARPRHQPRLRLARSARRPSAPEGKNGLGTYPWYTLTDDFDADFGVDEWHGTNAFIRDGDRVFRTGFINGRGDEQMGNTWNYLDITALGRQESWEDSLEGYPQTPPYEWWIWHDDGMTEADRDKV